jgi:hypothetical protein
MAELYGKAHEQGRVDLALVSRRGQHGVKPLLGNAGPIRDRRCTGLTLMTECRCRTNTVEKW